MTARLRRWAPLGLIAWVLLCAVIVLTRPGGPRASREPQGSPPGLASAAASGGRLEPFGEKRARVVAALQTALARMAPIEDPQAIDSMLATPPGADRTALARRLESHRWCRALGHLAPLTEDIAQAFPMFSEDEQRTYLRLLAVAVELTRADFLCRSSGLERPAALATIARLPGIRAVPAPNPDEVSSVNVLDAVGLNSDGALPASLWREASGTQRQVKLERGHLSRRAILSAKSRVAGVWNTFARITIRPRTDDASLQQVVLLFPDPEDPGRWKDHAVEIVPALVRSQECGMTFRHDRLPLGVPFGKIALENVQVHLAPRLR